MIWKQSLRFVNHFIKGYEKLYTKFKDMKKKIGDSLLMCNDANVFLSLLYLHEFLKLPQFNNQNTKKKKYVYFKFVKNIFFL